MINAFFITILFFLQNKNYRQSDLKKNLSFIFSYWKYDVLRFSIYQKIVPPKHDIFQFNLGSIFFLSRCRMSTCTTFGFIRQQDMKTDLLLDQRPSVRRYCNRHTEILWYVRSDSRLHCLCR